MKDKRKVLIVLAEEPKIKEGNGTWHRMKGVIEFLDSNKVDVIVMSGGIYRRQQKVAAAKAMRTWFSYELYQQKKKFGGIIICETASRDTFENILYSFTAADIDFKNDQIFVLSERGHTRRIKHIFNKSFGVQVKVVTVDYKNWLGYLKELFLYLYTLLDPEYKAPLAIYNRLVLRNSQKE